MICGEDCTSNNVNILISLRSVTLVGVRLLLRWKYTEFDPRTLNSLHGSYAFSIGVELVDLFIPSMTSWLVAFNLFKYHHIQNYKNLAVVFNASVTVKIGSFYSIIVHVLAVRTARDLSSILNNYVNFPAKISR